MKKLISILVVVFAVLALLVIFRNQAIKIVSENAVTLVTGFKTQIGSVGYDMPSTIQIKDLKIENPAGFTEKTFVSLPEIFVSLDLPALLKEKRIHLREMRLNLSEINIEKNAKGVSNVELLAGVGKQGQTTAAGAQAKTEPSKQGALPFYLDRLELTLHQVRYKDSSGNMIPKDVSVNLNVNQEVFLGISDPNAIVSVILLKVLYGTTFGNLGLDPEMLKGKLTGSLSSGQDLLKQGAGVAVEKAQVLTDSATKAVGQGTGVLKGTAGAATETVGGFLGKMKSTLNSIEGSDEKK